LTGVTLRPDGRLTADLATIERLKALCAQDAEELRAAESPPPPHQEGDIESVLVGLIHETSAAARKAFALARLDAHPGGSAEAWGIAVGQGAKAAQACAALVIGLAKHQGKLERRMVIEHHHRHVHQRIP
jgi:hypothetical protein